MQVQKSKVESLLGFAVKAGKTIFGSDNIESGRARYYLVVICATLSENTFKKVISAAQGRNVPIVIAEKELQYTVGRTNCKVLAITDKQFAKAIIENSDETYHLFNSEVK